MEDVIIAEDDDELFLVVGLALREAGLAGRTARVRDGGELLSLLLPRGARGRPRQPLPRLILLDLDMPGKDGRQTLKELKAHPLLRLVPVVVFTGVASRAEMSRAYGVGANSFVRKPMTYDGFVAVFQAVRDLWLGGAVLAAR